MTFLADLHIHSPYSRATSKSSNLAGLAAWAHVKGIHLIGTGDFTHPGWFAELEEQLTPAEQGLFRLKDPAVPLALPETTPEPIDTRFALTAEISSIYKRHGKVRKVHNIIFCPDLESARAFNARLATIGNIHSDGRPILGLDCRDLLEIVLEHIPGGFLVPAHIWTPWFSLFGSKSGFDSIEECFADLSDHIFALETGLSSDPDMNRLVSALDRFSLISNSDCHSPSKLGREVNLFDCDFSFAAMRQALEDPSKGFVGTVEFYPEEGKYHHDGHRKCGICFDPITTKEHGNICPVCGKPLTIGVSHRVMELADRNTPQYADHSPGFESLIPLPEILSELLGVGPASKAVLKQYARLIGKFGSEFSILRDCPIDEISKDSTLLGEAVKRLRERKVLRQAGFDGQFGIIHVFDEGELDNLAGTKSLFATEKVQRKKNKKTLNTVKPKPHSSLATDSKSGPVKIDPRLNAEQKAIVTSAAPHIAVSGGPGTGKTFTLTERMARLLTEGYLPENLFAITFTNKAADEIKELLAAKMEDRSANIFSGTFHTFCLHWLRRAQPALVVIGDETRQLIIKQLFANLNHQERSQIRADIISHCHFRATQKQGLPASVQVQSYLSHLEEIVAIDHDAIIPTFLVCLQDADFKKLVTDEVRHLLIDEFQDVNRAQYDLVCALADTAEVFIIGDPDQAIYGFRGSDLKFFFQYIKDIKATELNLISNYRSRPEITKAATSLIAYNTLPSNITLTSRQKKGGLLHHLALENAQQEGKVIARTIEELVGTSNLTVDKEGSGNFSYKDIAILFRMGRQAAILAAELENLGIPFQQSGAPPFFMKPEVRPLYHFLLTVSGKANIADTLLLLGSLKGIGHTTLDLIEQKIPVTSHDIWQELTHIEIPHGAMEKIAALHEIMILYKEGAKDDGSRGLGQVGQFLGLDLDHELVKKFIDFARALGGMEAVANHFISHAEATVYDHRAEAVSLMTMHSAKGLEFPVVFIAGLEEGLCPYISPGSDLEEERRLLYVAMTRAKEKLFLTRSKTRHGSACEASRFLKELPSQLFTTQEKQLDKQKKKKAIQLKLF